MGVELCASNVCNIRRPGDLEIQAASVECFKLGYGCALIAEDFHYIGVTMSVGLRFGDTGELDLGVCQLEKAANAADPSVLGIVNFALSALEEWVGDSRFLLDLGEVNSDLLSEFGSVKCVSA